jgi:hypothetical protein
VLVPLSVLVLARVRVMEPKPYKPSTMGGVRRIAHAPTNLSALEYQEVIQSCLIGLIEILTGKDDTGERFAGMKMDSGEAVSMDQLLSAIRTYCCNMAVEADEGKLEPCTPEQAIEQAAWRRLADALDGPIKCAEASEL